MDLKVSGLVKHFAGATDSDGFTLRIDELVVRQDEITVVMGHNGSGKSVLLRAQAGQEGIDSGSITMTREVNGRVLMRQRADESLAGDLTVRDNLLIRLGKGIGQAAWNPRQFYEDEIQRTLKRYPELARKVSQPVRNLSGGQRQILGFLALTQRPCDLLLLDEFVASVDAGAAIALVDLMIKFRAEHQCVTVVVTHDINWALRIADRIIVLRNGVTVADFNPSEGKMSAEALATAVSL